MGRYREDDNYVPEWLEGEEGEDVLTGMAAPDEEEPEDSEIEEETEEDWPTDE
jgi:hypothetical protein